MKFIREFLHERRRRKIWSKAYDLGQQKKFAEAAAVYADFAPEALKYNELSYCSHSYYAFEMYLKARDPENALKQARNALHVLSRNNGDWLKYDSGKYAAELFKYVVELNRAGYDAEADIFSREVNEQLEKYNVPLRCIGAPLAARENSFPSLCPHCGGALPFSIHKDALECSYCDAVIYRQ